MVIITFRFLWRCPTEASDLRTDYGLRHHQLGGFLHHFHPEPALLRGAGVHCHGSRDIKAPSCCHRVDCGRGRDRGGAPSVRVGSDG